MVVTNPKDLHPEARLIVLEGLDGVGKTTQTRLLEDYLKAQNIPVHRFREPGGTQLGEQIRPLLKTKGVIKSDMSAMLMFASLRAELMHTEVIPKLKEGGIVLLDRSLYSTIAYQGFGKDISLELLSFIDSQSVAVSPSDIIYLAGRPKGTADSTSNDAYETLGHNFSEKVRRGYEYCHNRLRLPEFTKKHRIEVTKDGGWYRDLGLVHREVLNVLGYK
jgi:dTMP kinase